MACDKWGSSLSCPMSTPRRSLQRSVIPTIQRSALKARGFIIFPGRLALADTFRIGCMGDVTEQDMADAMNAVAESMQEMGVTGLDRVDRVPV
jgi:aspartate aminotransferase-like enzyme